MSLEGVTFQHDQIYNYNGKDQAYYNYDLEASFSFVQNQTENYDPSCLQADYFGNTTTFLHQPPNEIVTNEENITQNFEMSYVRDSEINVIGKNHATRRRSKVKKNKEEINNQRMTHIAVERNRRKLMNEYLSALRSLMPESYVQRCDQASIVGGAINFIRELEHRLCLLNSNGEQNEDSISDPFSDIFKFPQFSMGSSVVNENVVLEVHALADIEVSLLESHASFKIRSRKRPKLLINIVSGLQSLGFIILHLNVSTVSDFVLYCFSTKMEDYCKHTSAADIATALYEILLVNHDS